MNFNSRNREGYPDPTFNEALYNITKEERQAKRRAEQESANRKRKRPPGRPGGVYRKNTDVNTEDRKERVEDDPGRTEKGETLGEFQADAG